MIAIQNTSTNFPIFPMSPSEEVNNALRSIASILSKDQMHLGIRHIPELKKNKVEKDDISKRYKDDPSQDDSKALLNTPIS